MFEHELDDDETTRVSNGVISVVSAVDGTDPIDLPPLAETIDPDALDELFDHGGTAHRRVVFHYHEYRVTVTADAIGVEPAPGEETGTDE